jgi:transcriptional regulator with XRE-family HTH domain
MTNGKPRRTKFPANLVGPQIRRLRAARGWSQTKLALRLQLSGLNIGREVLAQIEAQMPRLISSKSNGRGKQWKSALP